MIRYDLKCAEGHEFEAWFPSSAAFDEQAARGLVACACGSTSVEKALMAPRVPKKANAKETGPLVSAPEGAPLAEKLEALRREVEANTRDVGERFAAEARAMHVGDKEHEAIRGRASAEEAKSLIEDGVPFAPLPIPPRRDS